MALTIRIGVGTPEQEWQPALDWCIKQGLDPHIVRHIDVIGEGRCLVTEYVDDEHGHRQIDPRHPDAALTRRRVVVTSSPPPLNRS